MWGMDVISPAAPEAEANLTLNSKVKIAYTVLSFVLSPLGKATLLLSSELGFQGLS